jgi:tetratricopeptide (TPR) repeat protein/ADP-heptose:LPS heptosyltransferase
MLGRAPGSPDALRLLGIVWLEGGHAADAIPLLREALQADPGNLDVLDALTAAFAAVGDFPQVEEMVRRGLAVDGSRPVAHLRLGMALTRQGRWSEAARAFEDAIERAPRFAEAHHNLGDALTKLHRPHEAIACFRRALSIDPANPETHNSLGVALQEISLWGAAIRRYERALELDPAFSKAHYNLALAKLFQRDFDQGWPDYEARLQCEPIRTTLRTLSDTLDLYERLPRWRGPSEAGAGEVAIWAEQGIGDQILFSTLIPELIASAVPFLYEVDRRLLPAYERAFPGARFVALDDPPRDALQQAGRVLFAGSLPGLFRRAREDFARQPAKLLSALPERVAHYRQRLDALGPGLKVALSWKSTRKDWWVAKKDALLADFAPVLELPGVRFLDLQYGDTAAERHAVEASTGVRLLHFDEVDYFNDLEEVLAILEACDLLITTSNATAHFAGALGKRTWLLYLEDRAPFHYWAHGGSHRTPWYPSVEIVTVGQLADWRSLLQVAAERLAGSAYPDDMRPAGALANQTNDSPPSSDWLGRAKAMRLEGKLAEAVEICRRGLQQAPEDARVLSELAHALRQQDKLSEARSAAARAVAVAPVLASGWFNLGAVQVAQGETAQGIESYRKALELDPQLAEAWSNLGGALGATGDNPGEIHAYLRALGINPRLAPAWSNLGSAFLEAGDVDEAISACKRAVELAPEFAAGWSNLGNAFHEHGEHAEAVRACERAIQLSPELAEAWSNLGCALLEQGAIEQSFAAHHRALERQPRNARVHYNLGITQERSQQHEAAVASYRRAVELDAAYAPAWMRLACVLLVRGDFPEGWAAYEWRWREKNASPKRFDFTPWAGELAPGRRLLLWGEQGIGDEIIYSSMIGELAGAGLEITLEIDPRLAPLMRRSFPQVKVVARVNPAAVDPAAFDCQAPLAGLGRWLRPSFDSFPAHNGYLKADAERASRFSTGLRHTGATAVVGISWSSANREIGAEKSSALVEWAAVLRVPGVRFVDLQYGDTASARAELRQRQGLEITHLDDVDLFNDLEGLAALCAACDLVITVSNVTAHMAGALGKPVWLLAPASQGKTWYWFSGRHDSPWYPAMRIFNQAAAGSWREVLDAVARELAVLVKSR